MEKKTQRTMFEQIMANYNLTDEEVEFLKGRIAQLDKKAGKHSDTPTATQLENAELAKNILEFMAGKDSAVTISQIRKHFDLSPQKVTPIMTNLVNDNKVTKVVEKRVSYFTLA